MNDLIKRAVGILFSMDDFIMSVEDNETWLVYGVPDGEFEEKTREEAEANYGEHSWLITDFDGNTLECDDFKELIAAFKGATRNPRDYNREARNALIAEANSLLASACPETGRDIKEGTSMNGSKNYLTQKQLHDYVSNRKKEILKEGVLMEGPLGSLKDKIKGKIGDKKSAKSEATAASIVKDFKDNSEKYSGMTFYVDGEGFTYNDMKSKSPVEIVNSIVVKNGYIIRKGLHVLTPKEAEKVSGKPKLDDKYKFNGTLTSDGDVDDSAPEKQAAKMRGEYTDWVYITDTKEECSYAECNSKLGNNPEEWGSTIKFVADKKGVKYPFGAALVAIKKKQAADKEKEDANSNRIETQRSNKNQAEERRRLKSAGKRARTSVSNTNGESSPLAPKGKVTMRLDGEEIKSLKKLTSAEKDSVEFLDSEMNKFTYAQIKALPTAIRKKIIKESLDSQMNEAFNAHFESDDLFTESYSLSKPDMVYDDDASSINFI